MQIEAKQHFMQQWAKYFPSAVLPITFYYSDQPGDAIQMEPYKGGSCLIRELGRVRSGESLAFEGRAVMCGGGRYFLGFTQKLRPNFSAFISCGIPGQMEGERYKASPDLIDEQLTAAPFLPASGKMIIFKRWDMLTEADQPQVVIFFAPADVISGLVFLANFDERISQAVITPFGSGCNSIIQTPLRELQSEHPRAVLGMFDPSARPWVGANELTLAIPWPKFLRMLDEMDESFLITPTWDKIRARLS